MNITQPVTHKDLMLAIDWKPWHCALGWACQEKFDGVRALWTGQRLISRNGMELPAPDWFVRGLPSSPLDCELYAGPGRLRDVTSAIFSHNRPDRWEGLSLMVFDAPDFKCGFSDRSQVVMTQVGEHPFARPVDSSPMPLSMDFLRERIRTEPGLEGFILRDPDAPYVAGRTDRVLKFKGQFE